MSASAIVMLVVAGVTVWGGLVASIVNLRRNPDQGGDA
ncbi:MULTISPECIES: methionine/alanine import family NSS transporter small subunit [Kocuria]|uniref:Methionine/alanine import family NSS transporter small subunit n=1 Tax=Kocuria subflava TaxID=1736139 RepID=A0A846U629_9MICC|nr:MULTISPECIES: methionine/alanine import family NSS transporter small subunit [Kocuria]NKE10251.1 methionine/alanine import family NSS transporter small subunit [Kocuria subflava]